jgi:hypothetical protein
MASHKTFRGAVDTILRKETRRTRNQTEIPSARLEPSL